MTYGVVVERRVLKALRRLDAKARQRIMATIEGLADVPRPDTVKALTGPLTGHYRLRVSGPGGEYRVVYRVDDNARLVTVVDAGPREGTY